MSVIDRCFARKVVELGALALRLSRVERITFHPNGRRPETDSDHTVMLALIAPAFAARFLPWLDVGKITQFAVVHDLVEAYAGDTPTLNATPAQMAAKKMKEGLAIDRIVDEYAEALPWVCGLLVRYENQQEPEARYVRAMDKLMPKITHILNQGATFGTVNGYMDQEALVRRYARQLNELHQYAADFPPLFELRAQLIALLFETVRLEVST
jgi:putative hydrolases of HD superfamily